MDIYYSLYNRHIHIVLVDINDIDSIKICLGSIATRVKLCSNAVLDLRLIIHSILYINANAFQKNRRLNILCNHLCFMKYVTIS